MARINIEDSLLTDQRFIQLMIRLGSVQYALGVVVWALRQAQKHYLTTVNDRCIPFDEWKKQGCDDSLLDVGLAVRKEKGIWLIGSDEQFAWLLQKQKAGEKSGDSRKKGKKSTNEHPLTPVNERSTFDNGSEPLSSFLSSLSSNLNLSLPSSVLSQVVERVFQVYPRKQGLGGAKVILLNELKTVGDCHDFHDAVLKYRGYVKEPSNNVQNVYGFKGFAEVWKQWAPKKELKGAH